MTKVAIYTRISADRTGEKAGVTRQRQDCEQLAHDRGWTITATHSDNDISAAGKRRRPGFEALLDDINTGRVTVIIAWALDRLQRNRRDELRLYEACKERGVLISLVNGSDLDMTTAAGRFIADTLGSVARMEIEMKSDRQKRAELQRALAGKPPSRRAFGFTKDGTPHPAEANAVRDGYHALLAGDTLAAIAREWTRRGLTTTNPRYGARHQGKPSTPNASSVRKILLNPRNIGKRTHLGEIVADGDWKPIIDTPTFLAAKALLTDPSRRTGGKPQRLLTGIATCGICGETVHAGGSNQRFTSQAGYRCFTGRHFSRRADPIEDWVTTIILERLARADAVDLLTDVSHPDMDALAVEAAGLRHRLDEAATAFAEGAIDASQLRTATQRMRTRLAAIDAELADTARVDLLGELVHAADVRTVWDRLSVPRRRAVIGELVTVRIFPVGRGVRTFRPESVQIDWRREATHSSSVARACTSSDEAS